MIFFLDRLINSCQELDERIDSTKYEAIQLATVSLASHKDCKLEEIASVALSGGNKTRSKLTNLNIACRLFNLWQKVKCKNYCGYFFLLSLS